jgi:hypothetical protein
VLIEGKCESEPLIFLPHEDILEIVRLYLADRGAGLLPFSLASLVIILILMHIPMPAQVRFATGAVILVYWVLSLVFTSVQIATLTSLSGVEPRTATEYLNSDQIIDVAVIIALVSCDIDQSSDSIKTDLSSPCSTLLKSS